MSNRSLQSMIQSVQTCTFAPDSPPSIQEALVRDVLTNVFTQSQSKAANRLSNIQKHITSLSKTTNVYTHKHLKAIATYAYGFASTYLFLLPNPPLDILDITGELIAIGIKGQRAESITFDLSPNGTEALRNIDKTYPEIDIRAGLTKAWLREKYDVVVGRVYIPNTGESIVVPCDGMYYNMAMHLSQDAEIYRRGSWCQDCQIGCKPILYKKATITQINESARIRGE